MIANLKGDNKPVPNLFLPASNERSLEAGGGVSKLVMKHLFLRAIFQFGVLCFLPLMSFPQTRSSLLTPVMQRRPVSVSPDATAVRSRIVKVNVVKITGKNNRHLTVPLFGNQFIHVERIRQTRVRNDGFVWHGRISGEPLSSVAFSVVRKVMAANITRLKGEHYQIRYIGRALHVLKQIDLSKYPHESPLSKTRRSVMRNTSGEADASDGSLCSTDPAGQIDVLIAYTQQAMNKAGGYDGIMAEIYLDFEQTNQAFINSNIDFMWLNLIYAGPINYSEYYTEPVVEDGVLKNDLSKSSAVIAALNDLHGADSLVLIVDYPDAVETEAGYTDNINDSKLQLSIVRRNYSGQYTFTHEIGHQLGADHDCCDPNVSTIGYNHGYVSKDKKWRTVMASGATCNSQVSKENQIEGCTYLDGDCTRIQYFSNPDILYPLGASALQQEPMGNYEADQPSCQANNFLAFKGNEYTVPYIRCSSPVTKNVWMKDTWEDMGSEPMILKPGENAWSSPYIWVRRDQDPNRVHQFKNESLNFDYNNWIYVKLHNGGEMTSGELEVYVHNASTSYLWIPGNDNNWKMVGKTKVSNFEQGAFQIVEILWPSVPKGDYCLLARWVPDPPDTDQPEGETENIVLNVLNNNNLIWRNLNSLDVASAPTAQAGFEFGNPWNMPIRSELHIVPVLDRARISFLRQGRMVVHLDERLFELWYAGGKRGTGFKLRGRDIILTSARGARFTNLRLPPKLEGHVQLTFERLANTPQRKFMIDAIQYAAQSKRRMKILGGVSYEIHAGKNE